MLKLSLNNEQIDDYSLSKEESETTNESVRTAHSLPDVLPLGTGDILARTSSVETKSIDGHNLFLLVKESSFYRALWNVEDCYYSDNEGDNTLVLSVLKTYIF